MNKVICNLCGTSYPENAAQCPICGYARTADPVSSGASGNGTYTYVKGGRFSKANVKKRNQAAGVAADPTVPAVNKKKQKHAKESAGKGLVVVVILLLLAIVAVLGYVALRFFLPNGFLYEGLDNIKRPTSSPSVEELPPAVPNEDIPVESEDPATDLSCQALTVSQTQLHFEAIGAEVELSVTVEPEDTTDQLSFSSSDTAVATVSSDGIVTSVGEGNAVITVYCGNMTAQCHVTCTVPAAEPEVDTLSLNRKEITFHAEGESWLLYDGQIPVDDITWTSDDESIATIQSGKVIAVGDGDTTVYAAYQDQSVSCIIHCQFDEGTEEPGGVSEADGDTKRVYKLYNPTGYADDVTLRVGEKFTLKLVDENKEQVLDAQWNIENPKVCSYENDIVKALKEGTTEITATYEGVTYTCLVRVIEE